NIYFFHWRVFWNPVTGILSSATQRYTLQIGLYDAQLPSTPARRCSFTYTDNVVAGDWCCEYQKNGAANSQNDSLVAVALGHFYDLYLIIDPTNVYWLIGTDGAAPTQVFKTLTANVSAGTSNGFTFSMLIQKSVGTTAGVALVDL